MAEPRSDQEWVDLYVREELSYEDVEAFELRLMEDTALQDELEAALGIQQALRLDAERHDEQSPAPSERSPTSGWAPYAMAASVALAVVASVVLWRTYIEVNELRQQVAALSGPATAILEVPVDIMRSSGPQTPGVIINKPEAGWILFDIELQPAWQTVEGLVFTLQAQNGSGPRVSGELDLTAGPRAKLALRTEALAPGRYLLTVTNRAAGPASEAQDQRLIEIRAASPGR